MWMCCLETWFSGGLDSARLTIGLDDHKDLFWPKWFYDSMILCRYLLGACFRKKSVPKENNEVFMFWLTEALMLFHSMRATSFLRKTSAVPSGYFCFCSERENGKWEKDKMKCLWQENNVPEATPLNTERQEDRTPFILRLFCVFFFTHLIFYLQFISFLSWNIVLYSEKS